MPSRCRGTAGSLALHAPAKLHDHALWWFRLLAMPVFYSYLYQLAAASYLLHPIMFAIGVLSALLGAVLHLALASFLINMLPCKATAYGSLHRKPPLLVPLAAPL